MYNGNARVWDVENLKAIGEFFFGMGQSLIVLSLTKNAKVFTSLMNAMQSNLCKLKSIVPEDEIFDMLLLWKVETILYTVISICICIVCIAGRIWKEGYFHVNILLKIYCGYQINFALCVLMSFHEKTLERAYMKLQKVLAVANTDQNVYKLTDILLAGTKLDMIIDFRLLCYRSFCKMNRLISFGVYIYLLFTVISYYIAILILCIKTLEGTILHLIDETSSFMYPAILSGVFSIYVCLRAQGLLDLVR
ncbi:hypothetical protein Trydic_g2450 [Trypoxylus dichotomus]